MNRAELSQVEGLLVDLSTRFTGLPVERVGEEIERGLRLMVELLGTDRSTLFEFSPDGKTLTPLVSWARAGVELFTQVPQAAVPWYQAQLVRGETVRLARLPDDLPAEAVQEREYCRRIGLLANLTVPITVGGHPVCALAIGAFREARDWPDPVVDRVRLIGQVLASALYRQRVETELHSSLAELERTREELQVRLEEIRELKDRLEAENVYLRTENRQDRGFDVIVGESRAMLDVLAKVSQVAPTSSAVLLLGETGTGKQLLAHAVHERSPRHNGPFVKVNCAALPPTLIETELFGHEKGAFTGAAGPKAGRFELADGGTLFLDEIGELTPDVQVKLLGVLQDGQFERVGSTRTRTTNARIVAATNRDLNRAIAEGRFREDLYYRLSVFPIQVPPLRERREDIPLLVWACINRRQTQIGRKIERVPARAMAALRAYAWPGNIRELENVIERALILSPGSTLRLEETLGVVGRREAGAPPAERLDELDRAHIQRMVEACGWRIHGKGNAADKLGLHPNTLRSRMQKLGIARPARPS